MLLAFLAFSAFATGLPVQTPTPADETARSAVCRNHYADVECELERVDVRALSARQRAERARMIDVLRAYRERGTFGQSVEFPGARMPQFVDGDGRRCAVAELLHASGEDALIEAVRRADNDAWICDLEGDPTFQAWLARSGLSVEEAARIQLPIGGGGTGGRMADTMPAARRSPTRPGAGYDGPGDGPGTGPRSPGPGGTGFAPAPRTGGASSRPETGGIGSGRGPDTGAGSDGDHAWWLWWEFNKLAYLRPNRLESSFSPSTGADSQTFFSTQLDAIRKSLTPWLTETAENGDGRLRSAAALTLGRIARDDAVEPLRKLLADPSVEVRHRAILALGATAADPAASLLVSIARYGAATEHGSERISRIASPLAIVALGLGRRAGFSADVDAEVVRLVENADAGEHDLLANAAMIYQAIAPCAPLRALALDLAISRDESTAVRCRAIEALRGVSEAAVLSKLQHLLSGPNLELRRSTALALGGAKTSLALPALMTAFEMEAEPLTRGFLLIAIGEQGGSKAREFLLKHLAAGDKGLRCWSALALGIASRDTDDGQVREALRAATAVEKNRDALGAYWIASGMARDDQAMDAIKEALAQASNPRMRMYAATSLALIGTDAAHAALLERLSLEGSTAVRVMIGQALGYLGRPADAPAILEMMGGIREPDLQGLTAVAIGFHGSSEALRGLNELSRVNGGSSIRRAAAIDGLGMLLSREAPLAFGEVSRGSNYTVSPDWVLDLYQVAL